MPSFESFTPKPAREEFVFSSALEQRRATLENLTKKFPGLKSIVMAFVLTTAALSAPELAHSNEHTKETNIEQQDVHDAAHEEITHQELKSAFQKLWRTIDGVGADVPIDATYRSTLESLSVNGASTVSDEASGTLPDSAQDIVIGHEVATVAADHTTMTNHSAVDMVEGLKSTFYVSPIEQGSIVEGGTSQVIGFGSTRAEALQNALENAATFMGVDISSDLKSKSASTTGDDSFTAEIASKSHTSANSKHILKGYKIIGDEQPSDGVYTDGQKSVSSDNLSDSEHRVTVEIIGGTLVPAP